MVIEFKEKNKIKVGSIYPTIETIVTKSAKMTKGTPVRVLANANNVVTVEDYKGNQWEIHNEDGYDKLSSRSVDEMPKTYHIFKFNINIYQIINIMYKVYNIILGLIILLIIALKDLSLFNITMMVLSLVIAVLLPPIIVMITDFEGRICLFANKRNIKELQILLNEAI